MTAGCSHEWVNAGFTSKKMVCRKCNQEQNDATGEITITSQELMDRLRSREWIGQVGLYFGFSVKIARNDGEGGYKDITDVTKVAYPLYKRGQLLPGKHAGRGVFWLDFKDENGIFVTVHCNCSQCQSEARLLPQSDFSF